jgi:hypothetical protein
MDNRQILTFLTALEKRVSSALMSSSKEMKQHELNNALQIIAAIRAQIELERSENRRPMSTQRPGLLSEFPGDGQK